MPETQGNPMKILLFDTIPQPGARITICRAGTKWSSLYRGERLLIAGPDDEKRLEAVVVSAYLTHFEGLTDDEVASTGHSRESLLTHLLALYGAALGQIVTLVTLEVT